MDLGNLPHLRTSGLSLSERWTQAWSASECELPRGEGQDHRLLCSQGSGGGHARRGGRLARNAAILLTPVPQSRLIWTAVKSSKCISKPKKEGLVDTIFKSPSFTNGSK